MKRENNIVESYKDLLETRNRRADEENRSINEAYEKREQFKKDYYNIRESREVKARRRGTLMESCRNDALSTAIKAIYITALEAGTLTDNGLMLAESMVDKWIKENGGATKILGESQNNNYLLARIAQIVEEAAIMEADELEKLEDEDVTKVDEPETKEEPVPVENADVELATKVIEDKLGKTEEVQKAIDIIRQAAANKKDASEEPTEEEEKKEDEAPAAGNDDETEFKDDEEIVEDSEKDKEKNDEDESEEDEKSDDEDSDDDDDPLNTTFDDDEDESEEDETPDDDDEEIPDDATTTEDDDETDVADDITDDLDEEVPEDLSIDGEESTNSKGKIFDELEKEEDVQKAVELIRDRVADAEEALIKKNAEDKKAIDNLIGRISDNVKTVEDIADKDDTQSKIAEESARMYKQKINQITNNRPLTVLEKMTRNLTQSIVKNEVVRENYIEENGSIDAGLIVEAAKVMYGFLETINTLQLQKVDSVYIEKVLEDMK